MTELIVVSVSLDVVKTRKSGTSLQKVKTFLRKRNVEGARYSVHKFTGAMSIKRDALGREDITGIARKNPKYFRILRTKKLTGGSYVKKSTPFDGTAEELIEDFFKEKELSSRKESRN